MSNPLSNLTFHSPTLYEIDNSHFINMLERTIINNNEQNRLAQQAATELSNTITAMQSFPTKRNATTITKPRFLWQTIPMRFATKRV